MGLVSWEWIVIIAIVAIILIWGPGQIPKLAKALGQAKKELKQAGEEGADEEVKKKDEAAVEVDPLIVTAIKMGIDVSGKTKEQISQEILERSKGKQS
ncbi:MAG: twin-arginine translocase TatA/TatE family subunit [Nitrososphaerales archaeon]